MSSWVRDMDPRLFEVRCCCDAHLIGWLPAPARAELGRSYVFIVNTPPVFGEAVISAERLWFDYDLVRDDEGVVRSALKSRDYPIEKLRRIRGFRPAS